MAGIDQLVTRSATLKAELFAFAQSKRLERELTAAMEAQFGYPALASEDELIPFFDRFLLQHRLGDGRTVVERFVRSRGDLPRAERDLLLGWRDVVEGYFEVEGVQGQALVTTNLVDELVYRIHSNMGVGLFERTPPGSFLVARVVPVRDDWLFSGSMLTYGPERVDEVLRMAAGATQQYPQLVFRNPALLERAWQLQREDRDAFISHFGCDLVVLPGPQWQGRMQGFLTHRFGAGAPELPAEPELTEAETVGMIYDEQDGLGYYAEFGLFQRVFEQPDLARQQRYADIVRAYLDDDTVSAIPFRRCADAAPENADQVFARVLDRRSFSWRRDGDALLRRFKPGSFEQSPTPRFTPVGARLAGYVG